MRVRSLLITLLAGLLVTRNIEAWVTAVQAHSMRVAVPSPSSPLSGVSSSRSRAVTRWDEHLDLARREHRRKNWGQVRLLCTRVINIADDWNAVEQAHLRLALAEQNDKQVDAARRVFQEGTAACPSSDTLFMAWALMESKIHNARSRKVARALLRRAVALNPARHAEVLKWRVFLDWKEAGEAAVEAVRSAISSGQAVLTLSSVSSAIETTATGTATGASEGVAASAPAASAVGASATVGLPSAVATGAAVSRSRGGVSTSVGGDKIIISSSNNNSNGGCSQGRFTMPYSSAAAGFVKSWGDNRSAEKESSLAADLLQLCKATAATAVAEEEGDASSGTSARGNKEAQAARFEQVVGNLEKMGRGVVGGAEEGGRALSGTWRLVFTTCTGCDRVLTRAGSECYQRLTPPITEIAPRACEPPVPFRCEVLLRPSESFIRAAQSHGEPDSKEEKNKKRANKLSVAYFLRGWAHVSACKCDAGERVSLRQQVAPRFAVVIGSGGGSGGGSGSSSSSSAGSVSGRAARVPSPTPPPAVFSALGQVVRGGRGLEKLATQEATYVGRQLRIGRTRNGDVYVYERCAWPGDA